MEEDHTNINSENHACEAYAAALPICQRSVTTDRTDVFVLSLGGILTVFRHDSLFWFLIEMIGSSVKSADITSERQNKRRRDELKNAGERNMVIVK